VRIRKQKKLAKELIHAAHKVYHYRRDLLPEARLSELNKAVEELDRLRRDPTTKAGPLEAAMHRLDALLRKIGGKIYPKTFWSENLEVALVAAIIVIGIRTFFFQPFIIPTNSMFPTYSGMNTVVYAADEPAPNALQKTLRLLTLGARHKELIAESSGWVSLADVKTVPGRKWLVLPTVRKQYTFLVAGQRHSIQVPAEFDMRETLETTFPEANMRPGRDGLQLNKRVAAGDPILRFDITLGDALFVDRMSYHFRRPEAGEPFVFRTRDIPGVEGGPDDFVDKYYIKRIGGVGGEAVSIVDGTLMADGEPRDEVAAFGRNAENEGAYAGYAYPNESSSFPPRLLTGPEAVAEVPEGSFIALGDNSPNSLDSRYWGYVPEDAVIGKALFIYYPFTKRWGLAE
jgi:signal peptidase I